MIREIEIRLWNLIVGYAAYRNSRLVHFEYDLRFPEIYDLSPIMMPRSKQQVWSFDLNEETFHGLPGLLADSLPDRYGNNMIDAWFAQEGIALGDVSALDKLCYLGTRAMGALEFFPNKDENIQDKAIDLNTLVNLSTEILQKRINQRAAFDDVATIMHIGSSAGGARAKAVIAIHPDTQEIRSGQVRQEGFEYWIIKLDGITNESLSDPLGYTNIEYAYYLIARDCGIEMMLSKLIEENGRSHFLTKRFDRSDSYEKLHVQTLCALTHLDYNQARTTSYEILFRVANQLSLTMKEKEQLFLRMVFNVIGRNHDDHTKNFAFLMGIDAKWKLAPAYDLTFSYNPDHYWLKEHNLLINGKSQNITNDDLLIIADTFHIKNAAKMIERIQDKFSNFRKYALQAGVKEERIKFIEKQIRV